jgi:brefeldin A-inhibited guanine nucleotide-exchange protein
MITSLMNILSKVATLPYTASQQRANEPASPALSPQTKNSASTTHVSGSLAVSGTMDTSTMGLSEGQLRRQGLECLVAVLRSLVTWGTAAGKTPAESATVEPTSKSQLGEETTVETMTSDPSLDRLITSSGSTEALRQSTPDIADDPSRFESAKQKKTTLLEGIKKFNFKPKRVSSVFSFRTGDANFLSGSSILDRNGIHSKLVAS